MSEDLRIVAIDVGKASAPADANTDRVLESGGAAAITGGPSLSTNHPVRAETISLDEAGRMRVEGDSALALEPPRAGRRSRPARVALVAAAVLVGGLLVLSFLDFVAAQFERSPALGWMAVLVVTGGIGGVAYWIAAEVQALRRLRMVDRISAVLRDPREAKATVIDEAIEEVLDALRDRPELQACLGLYRKEIAAGDPVARKIALLSQYVLQPLDAEVNAAICRASAVAFGANFLSPTALLDTIAFMWRSAALVRTIAEIYGLRPGALGTAHLARRIVTEAGMVGTADAVGGFAANVVGTMFARLSADLASSTLAAQRIVRVGRLAQVICRPIPLA